MVKSKFLISIMAAFLLVPAFVAAVTVVECVNKRGESTFAERCPAGSLKKNERVLRGIGKRPISSEELAASAAREHPITLFAVENCEACVLVKNQLMDRKIPYTEVDVTGDREKFKLLTDATGGPATVPTLTIDKKVLSGHNPALLDAALIDAGYPATP